MPGAAGAAAIAISVRTRFGMCIGMRLAVLRTALPMTAACLLLGSACNYVRGRWFGDRGRLMMAGLPVLRILRPTTVHSHRLAGDGEQRE
ncbi:hypothetical protein GCM10008940_32100 [Microbulbifer agarilyticus]